MSFDNRPIRGIKKQTYICFYTFMSYLVQCPYPAKAKSFWLISIASGLKGGWHSALVHQQLSLHQLHHPHPSQWLTKLLSDVTRSIHTYVRIKSLLHVLSALPHFGLIIREYKAGKSVLCYSQLINWCLAPPLRIKKPQNSELKGFLLQVNLRHKTLISKAFYFRSSS